MPDHRHCEIERLRQTVEAEDYVVVRSRNTWASHVVNTKSHLFKQDPNGRFHMLCFDVLERNRKPLDQERIVFQRFTHSI